MSLGHIHMYTCVCALECLLMPSLHVPPHSQTEARHLLWACRTVGRLSDWLFLSACDEAQTVHVPVRGPSQLETAGVLAD